MAELTAGEKTFMESGGTDNTALVAENKDIQKQDNLPLETTTDSTQNVTETPEAKATREATEKAEHEKKRKDAIDSLGLVPKEALAEARQESKEMREELRKLREWQQNMATQLTQPAKPADTDPAPDPSKYQQGQEAQFQWDKMQWDVRENARKADAATKQLNQVIQSQNYEQSIRALDSWTATQVEAYKGENADYADAYKHAEKAFIDEQVALGADPATVRSQMINVIRQLSYSAYQQGKNPGELVMNYAKAKGYKKAAADDKSQEALARIAAGQQNSGGLNGGGRPNTAELTLEDLSKMPTNTPAQIKKYREAAAKLGFGRIDH